MSLESAANEAKKQCGTPPYPNYREGRCNNNNATTPGIAIKRRIKMGINPQPKPEDKLKE
jgi:hypothetical protein